MDPLTVGFDLDMTLLDSRPGIGATYEAISAETGVPIDTALVTSRLGPPLAHELANWFPADQVEELADRYRALYPTYAVLPSLLLPGAREAMAAVRAHGGRVVVVTGKYAANAQLHLDHLEVEVDGLAGNLWAEEKAPALREFGVSVYVGDHLSDILAARAADALAVGVPTGPISADELREAGADVVLASLSDFPSWLDEHLLAVEAPR